MMLMLSLQTVSGVVWREVGETSQWLGAAEVIHFITASSASSTLLLPVTQQHKTNLEVNINFLF